MPSRFEINFIARWRSCVGSDGRVLWDAGRDNPLPGRLHGLANCRPGHRINSSVYVITPAGADLIATADAIGFDPEGARGDDEPLPAPLPIECSTCGDKREVWIIGGFAIPCPDCGGGDVASDGPVRTVGEWRDLDDLACVEFRALVGKVVEARCPAHFPPHPALPASRVLEVTDHWEIRTEAWTLSNGDWEIRECAPEAGGEWVTEPKAIESRAAQGGS